MTNEISFKKQMLGKWRRNELDFSMPIARQLVHRSEVNEENMFREVAKLAGDGWHVSINGETMQNSWGKMNSVRMVICTKPK